MATPYNRQNARASTIAADLHNEITNKVILTTGVTLNGTGAQFVQTIAKHAPRLLILAGRSISKLQATADAIKADPKSSNIEIRLLELDLGSQAQIREAAKAVLAYPENIDVLMNSAGTMAGPWQTTNEGIEMQFGANHIGHFLFTNLIISKLLASPAPRVINVSSDGHRLSGIRFDDWNFEDGKAYNRWIAYGQSKTANIFFTRSLAEKLGPKGLKAYSLHPGVIFGTSLAPGLGEEDFPELKALDKAIGDPLGEDDAQFDLKSVDEGAATHVVAAFDRHLDGHNGAYLTNGNLAVEGDLRPTVTKASPEDPEKLWKLSEKLVGQEFTY